MARAPVAVVRKTLKAYADRGVFQDFRETQNRSGTVTFRFLVFDDQEVTVELVERTHTLVVRNMLRHVPVEMFGNLQDFLASLSDRHLPPHRRLDRRSADAQFVRRRGHASLVLRVKGGRYRYAADRLVSLVGWVRTHLQQWHPQYLWEVLGESEG